MKVSEALVARRSIKYFDPEHKMPEAEVEYLLKHALLSPTAFNIQNWRIVNVVKPSIRQAIREAAFGQPQMTDASLLLMLCIDLRAWERDPARYWVHAPEDVQELMVDSILQFYQDHPQLERDEGMRSASLLAMSIMLLAQELGYDSCPLDGFDFEQVSKLINLPDDHAICMAITVGKATEKPWDRGGHMPYENVVLTDRF